MKELILSNIHKKLGAKMVPFANYKMPIQYHKKELRLLKMSALKLLPKWIEIEISKPHHLMQMN